MRLALQLPKLKKKATARHTLAVALRTRVNQLKQSWQHLRLIDAHRFERLRVESQQL